LGQQNEKVAKMKTIKGDLLKLAHEGQFNTIIHGCNCFHTMGGGIARQIRDRYPQAYEADCKLSIKGDRDKLGTYTSAPAIDKNGKEFLIVNAYTQYGFLGSGDKDGKVCNDVFEYEAFEKFLDSLIGTELATGNIGMPMIGMGLAGGDSKRILTIIRKFDKAIMKTGGSVTMVEFG
jgi:O-acetyl-ADP-ribose deacetylase (regulator of RNase III)